MLRLRQENISIVSLYSLMQELQVGELASQLTALQSVIKEVMEQDKVQPNDPAPAWYTTRLLAVISGLILLQQSLEFDDSLRMQLSSFKYSLEKGHADLRPNALRVTLTMIVDGIIINLDSRLFLFVPKELAKHWNKLSLFGESWLVFPDAMAEMFDAINSYVYNLPTACVFHAMRVSEHGLRALAKKVGVSLLTNGKKCPIEYADWNKAISAIDNKIAAVRRKPVGPKKNEELVFWAEAASHCSHIKDIWRNEVSHTRTRYIQEEAFAALTRVADFMKLLAVNLYSTADLKRKVEANKRSLGLPAGP